METITVLEPDGGKKLNSKKARKPSTNKTLTPRSSRLMPRNLGDSIRSLQELPSVKANNPANSSNNHHSRSRQAHRVETLQELERRHERSLAETRRIKKSLKQRRNMQKRSQRSTHAPAVFHVARTPERRTGFMDVDNHGSNIRPDRGSEKTNRKKRTFPREKSSESRKGSVGGVVRRIFPCCFKKKKAKPHCGICSPMDA